VPFAGLLAILLGLWWWRTARADALAPIVALAGAFALNLAAKAIFARARPTLHPALVQALGYSFPSGHSQAALALYGTLAYLLARRVAPPRRFWIYGAGAAWTLLVGASRAYLEVHYPSDVLAAYAITLPWVLAVILAHHCLASPATRVPASAESR
jgi:undecaprenyl-diphosphatase